MRIESRCSLVAPLPFVLSSRIHSFSRSVHATRAVSIHGILRLPSRCNERYIKEADRTAYDVGKSLVVTYIIHTISGRVCRLGPQLRSRLHTRHQIGKNLQQDSAVGPDGFLTRVVHNEKEGNIALQDISYDIQSFLKWRCQNSVSL